MYCIKIFTHEKDKMYFYSSGISSLFIPLQNIRTWEICRIEISEQHEFHTIILNRYFILFQKKWRSYYTLLRRVRNLKAIRQREITGAFGFDIRLH